MTPQTHKIKKFSEFVLEQEEFNPLHLREGVMVNFDRNTFNRTYGKTLNESLDKKGTLERAYSAYELLMFANEKYNWYGNQSLFAEEEKIVVLEADNKNYLLMKNGDMFLMSKQTFDNIEHMNEGWLDDLKKTASDTWNNLGDSAKKAMEFAGKIWDAVKHFAHDNHNLIAGVSMGLMVVAGIGSFFPVAGPVIGGICATLAGTIHLTEGCMKLEEGAKALKGLDLPKMAKSAAIITSALPNLVVGGTLAFLGIKDLVGVVKNAVPGLGFVSAATNKAAKESAHAVAKEATKDPGKLLSIVKTVTSKIPHHAIHGLEHAGVGMIGTALGYVGSKILNWMVQMVLEGGGLIAKMGELILQVPDKLSKMISGLKGDTYVGGIVKTALTNFVKPFIDLINNFIKKYIEPFVKPMLQFFIDLPKYYKTATEAIEKHANTAEHKVDAKIHKTGNETHVQDIKLKPENKEGLKSAVKKVKVHEGKNYETFAEFALKN